MIPKVLFLTFLSWKSAKTPDYAPTDYSPALTRNTDSGYNRFSVNRESNPQHHVSPQSASEIEQVVIKVGDVQSAAAQSVSEFEEVFVKAGDVHTDFLETENFDDLPPGNWHSDSTVHGTFKLLSSTDERIYDVKDAFPDIRYDHKHAWGTYPNGSRLYIEFLDGEHFQSSITFAWLVNDKLVAADFHAYWFFHGQPTVQRHGKTKTDWTTLKIDGAYNGVEVEVHGGDESGILLVKEFQYDPA